MEFKKFFLKITLILAIAFLLARLFFLQILQKNKYGTLANENRIQKIKTAGPRGIITDRHGEILARNIPQFQIKNNQEVEIIDRDRALVLQTTGQDNKLFINLVRDYPQGEIFGHVTGYLGEVSEEEVRSGQELKVKGYGMVELIGRTGIEQFYETELRGVEGGELVEVDTTGKVLRRVGRVEPVPGKNLTLALDADLQRIAAEQMQGKKGAVVATNPQTGEVLVLYSSPSYDPNYFVAKRSEAAVLGLINDFQNRPLFNRAIAGLYPPGSTFKIVTSAAGLEEGKITKNTLINDPGVITVAGYKYSNWYFTGYGRTEGDVNVVKALKRSVDTYYYKLGEMLGANKIADWSKKFKLDKTFGLDLDGELAGFVPTPDWKLKATGESWFLGNTYHYAIGQGDLALTPLGVNMMSSAIANNGKICKPRMLKNEGSQPDCQEVGLKKETIEIIKEGMLEACAEGGTAYPFFNFTPTVACKTGTAEYLNSEGKMKTHAWFTAFASDIVITVLVEDGGEGSSVAAPIAKEVLKKYFEN